LSSEKIVNSSLSEWSEPPLPPALSLPVMRADSFLEAEIDDEIVALSIERGTSYGLNRVGSRIWTLLASPVRIRDLIATLLTEYQVDSDVCERQVLDLLAELRAEGLTVTTEKT
jgi:Coenzyme PQQ synthesis protein D (PqqD)